jgi:hypothetical protein
MDDHTGAIRCTFCWSAFSEPLLRLPAVWYFSEAAYAAPGLVA